VDSLLLVRSVGEDEFPAYNVSVDDQVRVVPLWQRRLQRRPNTSANAALEDDIIGPYYFLTELLQVPSDLGHYSAFFINRSIGNKILSPRVHHVYEDRRGRESAQKKLCIPIRSHVIDGLKHSASPF